MLLEFFDRTSWNRLEIRLFGDLLSRPIQAGLIGTLMYFDKYAPWEHYPKTLSQKEIVNPLSVITDFFSAGSLQEHKKDLKNWRKYVTLDKYYTDRHGPSSLLFIYDLNLKLLEAVYLVFIIYKNAPWNYPEASETQLQEEKEQWLYFPENLGIEEESNAYIAVKRVFKKISPQQYREHLHEWLHFALYKHAVDETLSAGDVMEVYKNLRKLHSAAWLIHQRQTDQTMLLKDWRKDKKPNEASITLRAIAPSPTPAEKLGLEEVRELILNRFPTIKMIVHLGTTAEPYSFFLLIVIANSEKQPENDLSNQIEEHCKQLVNVIALVHKTGSVKKALGTGRRFWNGVMTKGNILFKCPELILPDSQQVTNEHFLERAKFHWDTWGLQGKEFIKGAELYRTAGNYKLAAFLLHQAAESILRGIIQSVLGYPVTHLTFHEC